MEQQGRRVAEKWGSIAAGKQSSKEAEQRGSGKAEKHCLFSLKQKLNALSCYASPLLRYRALKGQKGTDPQRISELCEARRVQQSLGADKPPPWNTFKRVQGAERELHHTFT